MTRGTEFLNEVTEKLRKKIREIGETIQTVRKDIEGMNEYYWENYTEMDMRILTISRRFLRRSMRIRKISE